MSFSNTQLHFLFHLSVISSKVIHSEDIRFPIMKSTKTKIKCNQHANQLLCLFLSQTISLPYRVFVSELSAFSAFFKFIPVAMVSISGRWGHSAYTNVCTVTSSAMHWQLSATGVGLGITSKDQSNCFWKKERMRERERERDKVHADIKREELKSRRERMIIMCFEKICVLFYQLNRSPWEFGRIY